MKPAAENMKIILDKTVFKNSNFKLISNVTAMPVEKNSNVKRFVI